MKRVLTFILMLFIFTLPLVGLAATDINSMLNDAGGAAGYQTGENVAETGLATIVGNVVRIFLSLLGVIFICYTIYGGFLWMTSAGNEDKVTKGRDTIRDGVIGIIVTLGALAIYLFVRTALITAA